MCDIDYSITIEATEEPDLQIGKFRLWINGYQFPDLNDYWDGNWVNVTAVYDASKSFARADGPILHLSELASWLAKIKKIYADLNGDAEMKCMEPNLCLALHMKKTGTMEFDVKLTPDHLSEMHQYFDDLDQTFLPPVIESIERILAKMYKRTADGETAGIEDELIDEKSAMKRKIKKINLSEKGIIDRFIEEERSEDDLDGVNGK